MTVLLPLLLKSTPARVVSVHAGGMETKLSLSKGSLNSRSEPLQLFASSVACDLCTRIVHRNFG
jgi:hypothetical protein